MRHLVVVMVLVILHVLHQYKDLLVVEAQHQTVTKQQLLVAAQSPNGAPDEATVAALVVATISPGAWATPSQADVGAIKTILAGAELARANESEDSKNYRWLTRIRTAATRGAELVERI